MAARAIGSATVSFGLVSIPIKVYTTNQTKARVSFNMVHGECGTRLKQQYNCPTCEEVVPRSDMAKGYEFSKGQYVMLSADEIKAVEAVANNTVQLTEFVPEEQVDAVYFEKTYYLGPDKGGERAYGLLGEAMKRTGLVGLAKYASRGKEYIVLVRPYDDGGLIMHQLKYADEIKPFSEVPLEEAPAINEAELNLAMQIIQQIQSDEFAPDKYDDEAKQRVLDLIQQKIDGEEITAAPEAPQAQVIDLMAALKASLGAEDDGKAKPAKKAPAKKKPAAKKTKAKTTKKKPAKKKAKG